MKFRVIQSKEGKFTTEEFDEAAFVGAMKERGFETDEKPRDDRHLYPYLRGRPAFKEFHGPMADRDEGGHKIVRYEDWAVSNFL